ncbi:hypothetical protein [Psychrobacter glacincola]|uniref:hypothetical protein n=1 Tax=Psychrobacter glacincola TaxID=56810 RepID=UPI0039AFD7AF
MLFPRLLKTNGLLAIIIMLFLSTPSLAANSGADWTPYFKSWENACDLSGQEVLLVNLIPDYEDIYNLDDRASGKVDFTPGKIVLPIKYNLSIASKLNTTFSSFEEGSLPTKSLMADSGYFDANFNVVGKYYGMPITKIGFVGGIANGVYSPYFTLDMDADKVRKNLRAKNVSLIYEHSEFHDSDEYGNSDIGIGIYPNPEYPEKTNIVCDLSN